MGGNWSCSTRLVFIRCCEEQSIWHTFYKLTSVFILSPCVSKFRLWITYLEGEININSCFSQYLHMKFSLIFCIRYHSVLLNRVYLLGIWVQNLSYWYNSSKFLVTKEKYYVKWTVGLAGILRKCWVVDYTKESILNIANINESFKKSKQADEWSSASDPCPYRLSGKKKSSMSKQTAEPIFSVHPCDFLKATGNK